MKVMNVLRMINKLLITGKINKENFRKNQKKIIIISLSNVNNYIKKCFNFIGILKNLQTDAIHQVSLKTLNL